MASLTLASAQQTQDFARDLAIDLGHCQRKAVLSLIESRSAQRDTRSSEETSSLLSRASMLFGKSSKPATLGEIIDRSTNLTSLRRTGLVPEDIIQYDSEMTYKRLRNAYHLKDLVKFGFTFAHFRQLGFDVDDLRDMQPEEYRLLGLTAPTLLEHVPLTGEDLIQLRLNPHFLRELRFTFSHFVNQLSMTAGQLSELMSDRDLQMYFAPSASEMQRLRSSSRAGERITGTAERPRGEELPQVAQKSHNRFAVSSGGLKF